MELSKKVLSRRLSYSDRSRLASAIVTHQMKSVTDQARNAQKRTEQEAFDRFVASDANQEFCDLAIKHGLHHLVRVVGPGLKLCLTARTRADDYCLNVVADTTSDVTRVTLLPDVFPQADVDAIDACNARVSLLHAQATNARRDVMKNLESMGTVKALIEVWPDALPAIVELVGEEGLEEKVEKPLSAIINRHLGLISHTAAGVEIADEVVGPAA